MKRSELKTEIQTASSIRNTLPGWGEPYIIIDEKSACDVMAQCDFTRDVMDEMGNITDTVKMTAEDFLADLHEEEKHILDGIFELNGKFFVVDGDQFIEVDDPKSCTDGLLATHGRWDTFDSEESGDVRVLGRIGRPSVGDTTMDQITLPSDLKAALDA